MKRSIACFLVALVGMALFGNESFGVIGKDEYNRHQVQNADPATLVDSSQEKEDATNVPQWLPGRLVVKYRKDALVGPTRSAASLFAFEKSHGVLKSRLVVFGIDGWMHLSAVRQELGDYENACRNHQPVPPKGTETLEDKKTGADDRPIQGRRRITEQAQGKEVLVKKTKKGEVVSQ